MPTLAQASNNIAWPTLIGALGGVIITSIVALTTAYLNHKWQRQTSKDQELLEKSKELSKERQRAYAGYWSAIQIFRQKIYLSAQGGDDEYQQKIAEELVIRHQDLTTAQAAAMMVASDKVTAAIFLAIKAIEDLYDSLREMTSAGTASFDKIQKADKAQPILNALLETMKSDLS